MALGVVELNAVAVTVVFSDGVVNMYKRLPSTGRVIKTRAYNALLVVVLMYAQPVCRISLIGAYPLVSNAIEAVIGVIPSIQPVNT